MLLVCLQVCVLICNADDKEHNKQKWINVGEEEWVGGPKKGHLKSGEGKGGQSGVKRKHEKGASVAGKGKGKGSRSGKNAWPPVHIPLIK